VRLRMATDERRARLLSLGRALFDERPYDDIAIDDIAAAAGVSKGLLYHYFASKRDFYVETVRVAAAEMLERIRPPDGLEPPERLQRSLDAYLDYVESAANAYLQLFRGGLGVDPEVAGVVEDTRRALTRRILEEGLAIERPKPILRLTLRAWLGFVESAVLDWLDHGRDLDRATLRATLATALAHSLATMMQLDPDAGLKLSPG
jgi:AcrR family transcriptional regulator